MQNSYGLIATTPAPVLPTTSILPVGKEWETAMLSLPGTPGAEGLSPFCLPLWLMTFPAMPQPAPHISRGTGSSHNSWTHQEPLCSPQLRLPGLKIPFYCWAGDTHIMKAQPVWSVKVETLWIQALWGSAASALSIKGQKKHSPLSPVTKAGTRSSVQIAGWRGRLHVPADNNLCARAREMAYWHNSCL